MTPTAASAPTVTLLTKPGCHLCDDVVPVLDEVLTPLGLTWEAVDITTDEALYATYWTQIPVVLVDEQVVAVHGLAAAELRAALAAR